MAASSIRNYDDLVALDGHPEDRTLELKQGPIQTDELARVIQGAANGVAPLVRIIIGAAEKQGGFFIEKLTPVSFPFVLGGSPFEDFDKYKQHVIAVVRSVTSGYFEGLFEIRQIPVRDRCVIVIEVPQSPARPHHHIKFKRFYIKTDAGAHPIDAYEIEDAVLARHYRKEAARSPGPREEEFEPGPLWSVSAYSSPHDLVPGFELSRFDDRTGDDREVRFSGDATLWMKVEPNQLYRQWDPTDLSKLVEERFKLVEPFFVENKPLDFGRNDYGAAIWKVEKDHTIAKSATQIYTDGVLWASDTFLLSTSREDASASGKPVRCVYTLNVEEETLKALPRFVSFALEYLKHPPPLRVTVDISGVRDFRLVWHDDFRPRISKGVVYDTFMIDQKRISARTLLQKFFEELWKAAGRTRPAR